VAFQDMRMLSACFEPAMCAAYIGDGPGPPGAVKRPWRFLQ
jgi:hypothetical protein